jgi:hypothetical protein
MSAIKMADEVNKPTVTPAVTPMKPNETVKVADHGTTPASPAPSGK